MGNRTEIDTMGSDPEANSFAQWSLELEDDPVGDALARYNDGLAHYGTGSDSRGVFNVIVAPYKRAASAGNLLRVIISGRQRTGRAVTSFAISAVVETIPGAVDRLPETKIWQDPDMPEDFSGQFGEMPLAYYDAALEQPVLVTTRAHELALDAAVEGAPNGLVSETMSHYLGVFPAARWYAGQTLRETVAENTY